MSKSQKLTSGKNAILWEKFSEHKRSDAEQNRIAKGKPEDSKAVGSIVAQYKEAMICLDSLASDMHKVSVNVLYKAWSMKPKKVNHINAILTFAHTMGLVELLRETRLELLPEFYRGLID